MVDDLCSVCNRKSSNECCPVFCDCVVTLCECAVSIKVSDVCNLGIAIVYVNLIYTVSFFNFVSAVFESVSPNLQVVVILFVDVSDFFVCLIDCFLIRLCCDGLCEDDVVLNFQFSSSLSFDHSLNIASNSSLCVCNLCVVSLNCGCCL